MKPSLILAFLLCLQPLRAQEMLASADFMNGSIEPMKLYFREEPAPKVDVVPISNAPEGVGSSAVRLDDSEAAGKQGDYSLALPFFPQHEGVLVAKAVVRIPDEQLQGGNTGVDIRMSVGGKNPDGDIPSATYLRIRKNGDQFLWSVYDPRESKHRKIDITAIPGDWYLIEQRIDLQTRTYDWSIQNMSDPSSGEKIEGKNEVFFRAPEACSFLMFGSLARGGAIEIANISIERLNP